jgi:uncharacterized protein
VRFAWILIVTLACSNNGKREDNAPMPTLPPDQPQASADAAPAPQPTAKVYLSTPSGEIAVNVEIVATPKLIQKGLMFRKQLASDAGMLFLMPDEREWPFWMKNTLIPLDMLWIGKDMTVVGMAENTEPLSLEERTVGKPSLYVLEVNGGYAKQHQIGPGTKVRFEGVF